MVARPVVPSAPPRDEGYGSASSSSSTGSRGAIRLHSVSPFLRSVRQRLNEGEEEEIDFEAISCLLDFASRDQQRTPTRNVTSTVSTFTINEPSGSSESKILVRTFATSPPITPAPAPRPDRPPPIISNQLRHTCHSCVRPRALRGAPPTQDKEEEEEMELPDIPETPDSPATSDITVIRLVN